MILRFLSLLVIAITAVSCSGPPEELIIGEWHITRVEPVDSLSDNAEMQEHATYLNSSLHDTKVEFFEDGKYESRIPAQSPVHGTYRFDNDFSLLLLYNESTQSETNYGLTISSGEMEWESDGVIMVMEK